jgi:hypothetical protein
MSLQFLSPIQQLGLVVGFACLNTIFIAVACAQFQKLKVAILDIRQQYITPHHVQEEKQVHKTSKCNLQEKLNAYIRHHQEIME